MSGTDRLWSINVHRAFRLNRIYNQQVRPLLCVVYAIADQRRRNIFDWVLGFSADRVNPGETVRQMQTALVAIYAKGVKPWDAVISKNTFDKAILCHTPVVFADKDSEQQARGRQLVYSTHHRPWGIIPQCNNKACDARPGDVSGKASTHLRKGFHGSMHIKCKVCRFAVWIERPLWITPTRPDDFFFTMPWPLSSEQRDEVMGLNREWKMLVPQVQEKRAHAD